MRNGTIIQIKGLGIPVQSPSDRNLDGYEIRWSSDPEVSEQAPAHVLIGHDELQRFIELAVDRRFVVADLMTITPVTVPDGKNSLSRNDSVAAGVHPDNWNTVRVALVISGNGPRGPVMDDIEWVGCREEYQEGAHLAEAFAHAKNRGIKQPAIYPHTESGHIMRAAQFMEEFRRQMKPSLRAADNMVRVLESTLCSLDLSDINGDRASHYLRELQRAFIQNRDQRVNDNADIGLVDVSLMSQAQEDIEVLPQRTRSSSEPKFH